MRVSGSIDEDGDLPVAPRNGAGFFLLIVGIACCSVLILAALGSI